MSDIADIEVDVDAHLCLWPNSNWCHSPFKQWKIGFIQAKSSISEINMGNFWRLCTFGYSTFWEYFDLLLLLTFCYSMFSYIWTWVIWPFVTVPDRRCRILKGRHSDALNNLDSGNLEGGGMGKGLRKGRSVYKQPETEVDGSCHS